MSIGYLGVDLSPEEAATLLSAEIGGEVADIPDIDDIRADAVAIRANCYAAWRVRRRVQLMALDSTPT